jgi:LPXTG-motif cell wall-anchored protein
LTAAVSFAQTSTASETKQFRIIAVDGNRLIVNLPEGTRDMTVADDFRFVVDGKPLSVRELKPGMSGTATITTRTTLVPVTVTEVKNGTVAQVSGSAMIVRTDEGIKMFTQSDVDKRGVTIMREGKPARVSDFRANDKLSATIITSLPPRVMTEQEVQATLAREGGAPAAAAAGGAGGGAAGGAARGATGGAAGGGAGSAASSAPAASRQATGASSQSASGGAAQLPSTASPLPLLGLIGLASLATGLGLTARRRRASR